jgi:hypothetical protein
LFLTFISTCLFIKIKLFSTCYWLIRHIVYYNSSINMALGMGNVIQESPCSYHDENLVE